MDIDKGLLSSLLYGQRISELVERGFKPELMEEGFRPAYEFLLDFWRAHGVLPSPIVFVAKFAGLTLEPVQEPIDFWVTEAQKRFVHNALHQTVSDAMDSLKTGEPFKALDSFRHCLLQLDINVNRSQDVNMTVNTDARLERVRKAIEMHAREGAYIAGLSSPWPTLDRETLGWQAGQMVTFVSRTNIGKTWALCVVGAHAWLKGHKVLFVSKEMLNEEIQSRFDSYLSKLPARHLRRGAVSPPQLESYQEFLQDMREGQDLWISSDDQDGGLSSIAAKIEQYRPDLVMIDGFYLIRDESKSSAKWEQYTNISRGIKKLARLQEVPIIISTQFNRNQASSKTSGLLENMAFADALSHDSDVVLAFFRNQDLRDENEMKASLLKVREGELVDIPLHWNFDTMNFSEKNHQSRSVDEIEGEDLVF